MRHQARGRCWAVLAAAIGATAGTPCFGLIASDASDPTNSFFVGLNINDYIGADTFYNAGYTGTDAVIANIEAGYAWDQHETLVGKVSQYIKSPDSDFTGSQLGQFDLHATAVGQTLVGNGSQTYQQGIAYGATLWSGAIATTWEPSSSYNEAFTWTDSTDNLNDNAFLYPYETAMQTGINGRKADVINSSWSNANSTDGSDAYSEAIDALQYNNHNLFVASAGNSGAPGTVGYPADGYNGIAAGGSGGVDSKPPFSSVSVFSSTGPGTFYNPATGIDTPNVVPTIDILAPDEDITAAYYDLQTGGNAGNGSATDGATDLYGWPFSGTTFASAITAGGAALVVDAGYQRFASDANAVNGIVVKAVLLNSAEKLSGWNNNSTTVNGVLTTTQGLDFNQGAGELDLTQAYTQFIDGTTDVPGLGGGTVEAVGWDYGQVAKGTNNIYEISSALSGGTPFIATLDWDVDAKIIGIESGNRLQSQDVAFDQLDLQLWKTVAGVPTTEVADCLAAYNNVDQIALYLPAGTSTYALIVVFDGKIYDLSNGSDPNSANYGLAWSDQFPAPEPAALAAGPGLLVLAARRRRRAATRPV
jgi:hypothetical protein